MSKILPLLLLSLALVSTAALAAKPSVRCTVVTSPHGVGIRCVVDEVLHYVAPPSADDVGAVRRVSGLHVVRFPHHVRGKHRRRLIRRLSRAFAGLDEVNGLRYDVDEKTIGMSGLDRWVIETRAAERIEAWRRSNDGTPVGEAVLGPLCDRWLR